MAILNPDKLQQKKTECMQALAAAIRENDEAAMSAALGNWSEVVAGAVTDAAFGNADEVINSSVLVNRGVRQLTTQEKKYYQKFIEAAKSADPRMSIANITDALPLTVIDSVLDDIRKKYRLLELIDFQNTTAITKFVRNKTGKQTGVWGQLTDEIKKEISGSLEVIEATMYKLTAYMFAAKDLLDLGPEWVDRFVRETLMDVVALSFEIAIVDGDGKNKPIGMTRDISPTASVVDGVYPHKPAVIFNKITPTSYGAVLGTLAKGRNDRPRKIEKVILLVNPCDYFNKVFPATTVRAADGTYKHDILPYPTEVIQTEALEAGTAVIGLPKQYWCGIGIGKDGKIEYSDEYKFLEDQRTYAIKLHATGSANDNNAFVRLNINGLKPANLKVEVVSMPEPPEPPANP